MQCANNLKQMGIGVHNFHDTKNGIPPYSLNANMLMGMYSNPRGGALSFFGLLYPYIEQQALYDSIVSATNAGGTKKGFQVPLNDTWWKTLTTEQQAGFSLPIYQCPSKRSGRQDNEYPESTGNEYGSGPLGDYAVVVCANNVTEMAVGLPGRSAYHYCGLLMSMNAYNQKDIVSPIRLAKHTTPPPNAMTHGDPNTWYSSTDFSSIADGLSNQLLVGEKYVRPDKLGVCNDTDGAFDCTYLEGNGMGGAFVGRDIYGASTVPTIIARGPSDICLYYPPTMEYKFGGNHAGICNFLVGDSSVHAISASTAPEILRWLGHASDGNVVSLR
jgi:hypothetical protein